MSNNSILVIGGGFSGLTAALEAAEVGHEVYIVEQEPYLGGRVAQLKHYFPKLCPPTCGLEINFQRIRKNPRVKQFTMAQVTQVTGGPGNYEAKIKVKPRFVNSNCTACDKCVEVCPVERDSDYDFGMGKTKAIYRPHLMSFPMRYVIDDQVCEGSSCAKCVDACEYQAIDLDEKEREFTLNVGSIIVATGWKPYDVSKLTNLGGGQIPNVISNMQLERLAAPAGPTDGQVLRPSDGKEPKRIAFVQCAGSRDQNHLDYCSYICCMASLKHCTYIREQYPDAEVVIYYIDLRAPGRYENFLSKIQQDEKVQMVKGKVAKITEDTATGDLVVTAEDIMGGVKKEEKFDLVVLATGMQPSISIDGLAVEVPRDESGFITGGEEKGIFPVGCAKMPLDVMTSAETATGGALNAIQTVRR
ncbi:fumarate reductase/succinate dehydrogenase flavoprotein domain protein [Desulfonatronospira thiodismutans ASO3-1]|uniref:Fumarate reductase/succinate dehydrogenase flavoprotein domain protein n=1 Tax=Desulfonatronospira thiodismutans ASO3-1 TaxID=555779 RepID=D6SNE4_9BACT|nr:CoB--CoM heterodisulfide reductase iron-sulfur subunit A family protein [Desulfonatronospira thiodismutans]EFI34270.1 fumarate reductase/succinate dehydrogenase flavoprotein domain protein [Desulfonatronospira thiodismutans ASO3-1]